MGTSAWYVIHTKPHKENLVYGYLTSRGLQVFYPTIRVQPVNPRASTIRPYFPGYLFVHADLDNVGKSALQWIPGAIRLVQFGSQPATIPECVIHQLKQRISEIEAAGGLALEGLKQGDPVRITSGPLAGYEAIFDLRLSGSERAQVLLEMLGHQVRVQVNAGVIEKKRTK
jgi:transcription elongation factor/antiterminator RfaH